MINAEMRRRREVCRGPILVFDDRLYAGIVRSFLYLETSF